MTQLSRAAFLTKYNTLFADNTTRDISEADLRTLAEDVKDSAIFELDTNLSQIVSTKITIPTGEVLTLNATPKQIVDAQGAGTLIVPIQWMFYLDYNSVAYATNVDLQFIYGASLAAPSLTQAFSPAVQINSAVDTITVREGQTIDTLSTNVTNTKLGLRVGTGNPTAGNSPLYVYLTYRVITL